MIRTTSITGIIFLGAVLSVLAGLALFANERVGAFEAALLNRCCYQTPIDNRVIIVEATPIDLAFLADRLASNPPAVLAVIPRENGLGWGVQPAVNFFLSEASYPVVLPVAFPEALLPVSGTSALFETNTVLRPSLTPRDPSLFSFAHREFLSRESLAATYRPPRVRRRVVLIGDSFGQKETYLAVAEELYMRLTPAGGANSDLRAPIFLAGSPGTVPTFSTEEWQQGQDSKFPERAIVFLDLAPSSDQEKVSRGITTIFGPLSEVEGHAQLLSGTLARNRPTPLDPFAAALRIISLALIPVLVFFFSRGSAYTVVVVSVTVAVLIVVAAGVLVGQGQIVPVLAMEVALLVSLTSVVFFGRFFEKGEELKDEREKADQES